MAIKPALDKYCIENNLQTISQATIARIIKKLKESGKIGGYKCSYKARTGKIRYIIKKSIKKKRRKDYMPSPAGHLIQVDSITIFSEGIKNYLVNAIDVVSKFGFTYKYDNLNSYNAKDFIEKVRKVLY